MSQLYEKPLPVGKVGNYTYTINSGWLNGEPVIGLAVTCDGANVTLPTSNGNVLQAYFEGLTVGRHEVHWSWQTATRSDCTADGERVFINIVEC